MKYENLSYAKTVYGKAEIKAVVDCLNKSTQMGINARKFEYKIAKLFDKKYGLFVNSGSSALFLGIESLGLPPNCETEKKYICELCSEEFLTKACLGQHKKNRHPVESKSIWLWRLKIKFVGSKFYSNHNCKDTLWIPPTNP